MEKIDRKEEKRADSIRVCHKDEGLYFIEANHSK